MKKHESNPRPHHYIYVSPVQRFGGPFPDATSLIPQDTALAKLGKFCRGLVGLKLETIIKGITLRYAIHDNWFARTKTIFLFFAYELLLLLV